MLFGIDERAGAAAAQQTSRTLVPSVALRDTRRLVDEIVPGVDVDRLAFTPVSKLYFYKHVGITTLLYAIAGIAMLLQDFTPMRLVLLLWPFHLALVYLRWRRAGLAVHGESIVEPAVPPVSLTASFAVVGLFGEDAEKLPGSYAGYREQPTACGAEQPPEEAVMRFDDFQPQDDITPDSQVTATIATDREASSSSTMAERKET